MESLLQSWNKASPLMTTDEQQRFWKESGKEIMAYQAVVDSDTKLSAAGRVRSVRKQLSDITRAMKIVRANQKLNPDQKRASLIELTEQRNAAAKDGFTSLFPEAVRKRYY